MSKNLVIALFLGSITPSEAKIRPLVEQSLGEAPVEEKAHERKVRNSIVTRCQDTPLVGQSHASTHPLVERHNDLNCQNLCVFKDDDNQWCFSTTTPMLTTGWNWTQYTGSDFW